MRILLIDNYDSFTCNLLHLIERVAGTGSVKVVRNDRIGPAEAVRYERIVISPGPGVPHEAGEIVPLISELAPTIPLLGICLGHQAIAQAFGASISPLARPLHGVRDRICVTDDTRVLRGLEGTIHAGRYHSWIVSQRDFPGCLQITAVDGEGRIMGLSHRHFDTHGIQFHPESFMTDAGETIIRNFIKP